MYRSGVREISLRISNIAINVVEAGETACAAFNSLEYVGDQTGKTINPARLRISDTVGLCPAAFQPTTLETFRNR